jgi:SsrA-binding protein
MSPKDKTNERVIAQNKKAYHDYEVLNRYDAGIELGGTEVKSIRQGNVTMLGSFIRIEDGQAWIHNLNISLYDHGNRFNHEMARPRRLLLHRAEIDKCKIYSDQKGLALVPLSIYLKGGWVKIRMGVCRGKANADKRETLKKRTSERESQRSISQQRGKY